MKLYAISSDGKERAAIWVQAIYWDMIMNAYKRTGDERYKTLIKEIYQGGYEQYSAYDWTDEIEWFIYDDMMWWIISLGRAYQITGDPCYLADASSGFFYVWKSLTMKSVEVCGGISSMMQKWLVLISQQLWGR